MRLTSTVIKWFLVVIFMTILALSVNRYARPVNRITPHLANPHYGGTLVWGTINPPTIINPVLTSHSVSTSLLDLIFDPLVHIDEHGTIVPGLAQSWDVSSDGLRYTFHLREKVYFHDGVECTAEDVKFTYEAIHDPVNQSPGRNNTELISRWDVVDRYTIRVILKKQFPLLLFKLVREILPKHLYEHTDFLTNPHNYSPVGTGPFRLTSWDRTSDQITLEANEHYFEGRPFLDKILIKTYPNNSDLWGALMRGEVDFVKFLNEQDYEVLSKDPAFKTYQVPAGLYFALVYNTHDPVLSDQELRHALNYAIDRKSLMRFTGINGIETNGPFYPQSQWSNKEVEAPSYNPVRAKLMLAWRGWVPDSSGILRKGGQPLVLTMLVNRNNGYYRRMALVLRQQLSEVGIALKIVFYDNENQLTSGYLDKIKPQMWLRMFAGGVGDPSELTRTWYSDSSEFGHLWSYRNPAIDRLFEQGLTLHDSERRAEIYRKIHALIYEDQPASFLFYLVSYHAINAKFRGTNGFFTDYMPDYLMKQWFIADERR